MASETSRLPRWAELAREGWTNTGERRPAFAETPTESQESVWDYPRPPRLVSDDRRVVVKSGGIVLADTSGALRMLETAHPPTFYLPRAAVRMEHLVEVGRGSRCEWKGEATYFDVAVEQTRVERAAWSYQRPFGEFAALAGHIAFYPGLVECFVAGERVTPQPGAFYGGWITSDLAGPFKGEPGSGGW